MRELAAIARVAIIGAGPAHRPDGMALALACRRAGFATVLEDVLPGNLRRAVERIPEADRVYTPELAASIEDAVREADLVLDTVPDELESKLEIFSLLDRMAPPRTVFVTPTRTLSIDDLASCTYRSEQCFGMVFEENDMQPGFRVTLTGAAGVSAAQASRVTTFLQALGARVDVRPPDA